MDRDALLRLGRTALPIVAVLVFFGGIGAVLATAGDTWGYDYRAYVGAAQRLLDGQPLYDPNVDVAGGFAIYLYPPPFAVAMIPFALVGDPVGLWLWTGLLVAALAGATWAMPIRRDLRWGLVLAAGLFWPALYSIKLGQVGPLLLLLFAAGWRLLDRPIPFGSTVAAGTLIKVQPALLGVWAVLTGRWRAAAASVAIAAAVCLVTLPVVGVGAWTDYVAILTRVNEPITTPHNFTLGATLYQLGVDAAVAGAIQTATLLATLVVVVVAARRRLSLASFVVAVVATQLLSPLLWDHYAVILLLPVGWALAAGLRVAWAIPIAFSLPLVGLIPAIAYPLAFLACLIAPLIVARTAPIAGDAP